MIGIKGMLKGFALVLLFGLVGCATRYPYEIAPPRQSTETCFHRSICIYDTPQWERFTLDLTQDGYIQGLMLNKLFVGRDALLGKTRYAVMLNLHILNPRINSGLQLQLVMDCLTGDVATIGGTAIERGKHTQKNLDSALPLLFVNTPQAIAFNKAKGDIGGATFVELFDVLKPTICQNYQQYQVVPTDFR